MAFPLYIEVPMEFQEDDYSCVPLCVKMIFDFIHQNNKDCYIPICTIEEIKLAMGTDLLGTSLSGVDGLNEMLLKARPSIEFEGKENCSLSEIEQEIRFDKPVIAWLKMPFPHSVVITGIDMGRLMVFYNDPQKGKEEMQMGKFMSCWEAIDKVLIKVKIGENKQTTMPEFVKSAIEGNETK
jgi:hypothetical protein